MYKTKSTFRRICSSGKSLSGELTYPLWRKADPVFILSSGRTGTDSLHHLFARKTEIVSRHEPRPQLMPERQLAYQEIDKKLERYKQIFKRARGGVLFSTCLKHKKYIETSARLTFFAPAIADLLPQARFIYMHRHPAEIVTSGMRRGWYQSHPADKYRIYPRRDDPVFNKWVGMKPFEKICWYWAAYNRFALEFVAAMPFERILVLPSVDYFSGSSKIFNSLSQFVGTEEFSEHDITNVLGKKHNAQVTGNVFPQHQYWTQEQRDTLRMYAGEVMEYFGYE